jgi:galactokinase
MKRNTVEAYLDSSAFESTLVRLYGEDAIDHQKVRYRRLFERFIDHFPKANDVEVFSSSGRIEVIGNHTDHQLGKVLAMAVDLDTVAFVSKNEDHIIRFVSQNYEIEPIDLTDLEIHEEEYYTTMGLLRGLAYYFKELYGFVGGFDAYVESNVMSGSGLSSSASVEILIVKILESLYGNGKMTPDLMAIFAQRAENNYFSKPCGLMDQMVIAHGGFCAIDFYDANNPVVTKIDPHAMFEQLNLCLVQSGGSHADLSGDYAEIFNDCKRIAKAFDQATLSRVDEASFRTKLKELYQHEDSRAILRAHHIFTENKRVSTAQRALESGDLNPFLDAVNASGRSSALHLRNVWNPHSTQQGLAVALMMAEALLEGQGAFRVHGGGFAGTILMFVPKSKTALIKRTMESVFGEGSFIQIRQRPEGVIQFIR